jgi:predicted TIM-barrel fold metal-dependent hydrolase
MLSVVRVGVVGATVGLVAVGASSGCKPAGEETGAKTKVAKEEDDDDAPAKPSKTPPRPIEDERTIRALEAEVASLKRQLEVGAAADPYAGLINAHEHLYKLKDLERYLPAARKANVAATVIVASPLFTLEGKGEKGEPSMSRNFEDVLLVAAKEHPGEILPFCTIDPKDPDKLERLKKHIAMGAKGVKIYSGHSNFADGPLDPPDMDPVLSYLEETQIPINWHINLAKFMDDFEGVMKKHPKLNLMVPHYGVSFWKPDGPTLSRLAALMREHKNLIVDTSLGTREILLNGMSAIEPAREKFKAFFVEFQDQIIWGTDSVITGNQEKVPSWYSKVIWATRDHLEKDVFDTDLAAGYSKYYEKGRDGSGRYQGLGLPPEILKKVYSVNTRRWLHLDAATTAPPTTTPTATTTTPAR